MRWTFTILICAIMLAPPDTVAQDITNSVRTPNSPRAGRSTKERVLKIDLDLETTISMPAITMQSCPALINISFHQRNTIARLNGEISYAECAQSSGSYNVEISIRDSEGEASRLTFEESWENLGAESLEFRRDYPIGDNMVLSRISTRNIRCSCTTDTASVVGE